MIKQIIVKLNVAGLHLWQNCHIEEVEYLKNLHRHLFYITCYKTVKHDDRDIEFIQLKQKIEKWINEKYYKEFYGCCLFDKMSCEMIAVELINAFGLDTCEVLEDNENGARISK